MIEGEKSPNISGYSKINTMLNVFNKGKGNKLQRVEMISIADLDIEKSGTIEAPCLGRNTRFLKGSFFSFRKR